MFELNNSQKAAMEKLMEGGNVFLTGAAGTGKSFLMRQYLSESGERPTMLATTGVAAIILGGRTFHAFFSLWDFGSPYAQMIQSALNNQRMLYRVRGAETIVIDEVSMLDARTMNAGEEIARIVRGNDAPWGGLRVIAVGDFCQLPPVDPGRKDGDPINWVFNADVWKRTGFETVQLTEVMRTGDTHFMDLLGKVRSGVIDDDVKAFLQKQNITEEQARNIEGSRIFARKVQVEKYNKMKLAAIDAPSEVFHAQISGQESLLEKDANKSKLLKSMPVDEVIELKKGALVMIRANNTDQGYANGSLAHYEGCENGMMEVVLVDSGMAVYLEKKTYEYKDGDGKVRASAEQYPVSLAWATTIHKAQGATLDCVIADIRNLWESGQAYVAMSRTKTAEKFYVLNWNARSVLLDPQVRKFYNFPPQ